MIHYDGKRFAAISNTKNGEVSDATIFHYHQDGALVWAEYSGGGILKGFLIGRVHDDYSIEFHYQHMNTCMETRIGRCRSIPEILPDNRLRLQESWQWLNGDCTAGESIIEEIRLKSDRRRF